MGVGRDAAVERERELLLDVSRLLWRVWRGGLPTGIDRVCLAYVRHFAPRALAVVQWKGFRAVLSAAHSDRIFDLLTGVWGVGRAGLVARALLPIAAGRRRPKRGMLYLNVGHTGLNHRRLPQWIRAHRLRAVYMIHDLIPITHPSHCRDGEEAKHRQRLDHLLISASGVIGNSQASLDELAQYAASSCKRMPPSIAAWISGWELSAGAEPRVMGRPYFVTLDTIEGRKNHRLLLNVWRRLVCELGGNAPLLVIIGQRGWQAEDVIALLDHPGVLNGHVLELGRCEDQEVAEWIAGARALLMPSFAEGFGLPVIEALHLGTPVIASNLTVFREVAGGIPTFLDPADEESWCGAVRAFAGESSERERQLAAIDTYRAPTWDGHFARVERWLESLPPPPPMAHR